MRVARVDARKQVGAPDRDTRQHALVEVRRRAIDEHQPAAVLEPLQRVDLAGAGRDEAL